MKIGSHFLQHTQSGVQSLLQSMLNMLLQASFRVERLTWSLYVILFILLQQGTPASMLMCLEANHTQEVSVVCKTETACFALWQNESGKVVIFQKGCWLPSTPIVKDSRCIGTKFGNSTFCICRYDLCNANLTFGGVIPSTPTPATEGSKPKQKGGGEERKLLFVLVPIVCISMFIVVVFLIYLKRRPFPKSLGDPVKNRERESLLTTEELPPIELKDVLSQGQFCIVRKGTMGKVNVAVKIFPVAQRAKATPSALTEKDIYITCKLTHQNILKFIAAQSHEEGNQAQLWLITEYIEKGSLADFLKRNIITWDNLCKMAEGMASGMAYLHAEIPKIKPSIAHRDMKSKNVLVKNDLTCCISDFGLSLKFDNKDGPGDTHGQVGTRRYMAPEVLEGAINFSREAFLRIDMYAFGLCLWELLSRCTAVEGSVGDYKFPYEEEVGMHPSLEELQNYVVQRKERPKIREEWRKHESTEGVVVTIEECWDHDADARLTADCVAERVKQLRATINAKRQANTPLSVSLNINSDLDNGVMV